MREDTIKIKTWNYKVSLKSFSFEYKVTLNKKVIKQGKHTSSHRRSIKTILGYLKKGFGSELLLEEITIK